MLIVVVVVVVVVVAVLLTGVGATQELEVPAVSVVEQPSEVPCSARASKVVCAHEKLKEKGLGWLMPAILIGGVLTWFVSNYRPKARKKDADPL